MCPRVLKCYYCPQGNFDKSDLPLFITVVPDINFALRVTVCFYVGVIINGGVVHIMHINNTDNLHTNGFPLRFISFESRGASLCNG